MRFNHFRQILRKIEKEVCCPRCGGEFLEEDIEVQGANQKNIEFLADCEECGAEVVIYAHIEKAAPFSAAKPLLSRKHSGISVSSDSIQNISQTLRSFRGRDVRELF